MLLLRILISTPYELLFGRPTEWYERDSPLADTNLDVAGRTETLANPDED
jgi:hypothetical protein